MSALCLAMWSGPRCLSTALMRSWENRADTEVWDEPLYAAYLHDTGLDHPMAAEVMAAGESDWRRVVERCCRPGPGGRPVFFQKHMTHHLLPHMDRAWLGEVANAFLIRDPRRILASYVQKREAVTLDDIGLEQQVALFEAVAELTGRTPPVIDASDLRQRPRVVLGALCTALGIAFDEAMLSWPAGPRPSDGVWASHWYGSVFASTGFTAPGPIPDLPPHLDEIAGQALPLYGRLARHRLTGEGPARA